MVLNKEKRCLNELCSSIYTYTSNFHKAFGYMVSFLHTGYELPSNLAQNGSDHVQVYDAYSPQSAGGVS